jgi:TonB family protein
MSRLALALALSLSLHAVLGAMASGLGERPEALPKALPTSERVEIELIGTRTRAETLKPPPALREARPRRVRAMASRGPARPIPTGGPGADEGSLPIVAAAPGAQLPVTTLGAPSQISAVTLAAFATAGEPPSVGGPEAGGGPNLGAFVERLRKSAQRCSPKRAGPAGEASMARVRFCVDPLGKPEAVTLLQSTGDPRLDRAALECVIPGAAPLPATDRCLVVPLRFSL